jgi:glutamate/tyrosine decarboxylase-like PLP-dependent enzyme
MTDPSYRETLEFLANLLPELAAAEAEVGVRPPLPPADASTLVPAITDAGRPVADVLETLAELARRVPITTTPKFFNQLFSGRDAVATVADMLTAHLNVSMYTYKAAGPLVLAENALVEHMLGFAGFAGGEGSFTTGGSLSNLLAIAIARNEAAAKHGETARLTLYTSAESHYSVAKAVTLLGLGRKATRKIPTDEQGRMRPELLAATLRADIDEGIRPVMINATAGTTVMGAFDPIDELADVAREHDVWIHVDGAWGGAFLLVPDARARLFAGLERCDSLTWDAHKLMGVPLTCSILLLRERGLLERHLGEDAEYLFQVDTPELNPGIRSIQCGRRNDALKLWAAWQHHGDAGYRVRLERLLSLRDHVVARIEASSELQMCHVPESLNVCFEMPGVSSEQLCSELNTRGLAVVGHARVNGRSTIRLVIANPSQSELVLDEFLAAVLQVGAELREMRMAGAC